MRSLRLFVFLILLFCRSIPSFAQDSQVTIADRLTLEPLSGASLSTGSGIVYTANEKGQIILPPINDRVHITVIGYQSIYIDLKGNAPAYILLDQQTHSLDEVFITANRQVQKRIEAPVAISNISSTVIHETHAISIDQLVNKISGVFMVNLGNEQHSMSIRQPMSTKSLYLYLEDGIPVRTSGVFNHNALLEMNMTAVRNIEVIRGPSSSMYGGEAIGGAINFITTPPPADPDMRLSIQGNTIGYRRTDISLGNTFGKLGININGYLARTRNGVLDYSDFSKFIGTLRADYTFNSSTNLLNTLTVLDYSSDMRGGLDSADFENKNYSTPQTFTYRDVSGLRFKSQLNKDWNNQHSSSLAFVFRDNSVKQNPAYSIRDDYRKINGVFIGNKQIAHGEINDNYFKSYVITATHQYGSLNNKFKTISGITIDYSPAGYTGNYIRIKQDSMSRKYLSYEKRKDSLLSNYTTDLSNAALFSQIDYSLSDKLKLVAGMRYDLYHMNYDNSLPPSAFSGAPDTKKNFYRFTPKLGFTWQAFHEAGFYANYSEGFVAPQITELFRGVKVANLAPQTFYNYEAGGWLSLSDNSIYADWSIYLLEGKNEIITVRMDDGTLANANAGKTRHYGIEYGITLKPLNGMKLRFSAANSKHYFVKFIEKGVEYNNNEMNNAPGFVHNSELSYKPTFLKNVHISLEYQHMGRYWQDPLNTSRYDGFDVFNLRLRYELSKFELWMNILNLTDTYYATNATKSSFGYSYNIGDPVSFNAGIAFRLNKTRSQ